MQIITLDLKKAAIAAKPKKKRAKAVNQNKRLPQAEEPNPVVLEPQEASAPKSLRSHRRRLRKERLREDGAAEDKSRRQIPRTR